MSSPQLHGIAFKLLREQEERDLSTGQLHLLTSCVRELRRRRDMVSWVARCRCDLCAPSPLPGWSAWDN